MWAITIVLLWKEVSSSLEGGEASGNQRVEKMKVDRSIEKESFGVSRVSGPS